MLILALLAGCMDWKMQRHLESMSRSVRTAMRLATLDLLENAERYQIRHEAYEEEHAANILEEEASVLEEEGRVESLYAERERMRAHDVSMMASIEQQQADAMHEKASQTEQLRHEVLTNLTLVEEDEKKTLQQMRTVRGICHWKGLHWVCDTLGGITGLQQKADSEALLIQTEWGEAAALDRQEKLQTMVSQMLQGKAERLNKTSNDMLRVADLWASWSKQELDLALLINQTATQLEDDAQKKEEEESEILEDEILVRLEAHKLLHVAQLDHISAYWYAVAAVVTGFCSCMFFASTVATRTLSALQRFVHRDTVLCDAKEIWHTVSYCTVHILLFLVVVGMTGSYFFRMSHYDVGQRASLLIWFAFLGSVTQTFFLHIIPRFLIESRSRVPDLEGFLFCSLSKLLVLFLGNLIEVLFIWLLLGKTLFSPWIVNVVNTIVFLVFTVVMALLHVYLFDQQRQNRDNESVTVWRSDDEATNLSKAEDSYHSILSSECTPLGKDEVLSAGTVLDLEVDDGTRSSSTVRPTSPSHHISTLREDLYQLLLPFLILVIAAMVSVLRNCLRTVWNTQATGFQCAVLGCALVLLLMGAVLVKDLTYNECCDMVSISSACNPKRRWPEANKSDAFELIAV